MVAKSLAKRRNERSYRYGRWLLIGLALVSIPLDGQKMYEEVGKAKIYLNKSMYDTINFYSATLMTHIIGVSSAFDHEIWLTVACRLICTFVYQYDLSSRSNDTIPSDPKEMQKMLREKYPQYMGGPGMGKAGMGYPGMGPGMGPEMGPGMGLGMEPGMEPGFKMSKGKTAKRAKLSKKGGKTVEKSPKKRTARPIKAKKATKKVKL